MQLPGIRDEWVLFLYFGSYQMIICGILQIIYSVKRSVPRNLLFIHFGLPRVLLQVNTSFLTSFMDVAQEVWKTFKQITESHK